MPLNYKIENRRVIPNWRDFKRTVKLNELTVSGQASKLKLNLENLINDWNSNKTIGTAADLISGFFSSNNSLVTEVDEATQFIINNSDKSSKVLLDLANAINFDESGSDLSSTRILEVDSITEFQQYFDNHTIYKILGLTKTRSKNELKNPIIWVELSRLYAFLGQEKKAENAMLVALQLAPDNRYVLRSATRLFVHFENHERALYYLRKSEGARFDPWLISAHIATSSIMGRYSPLIKSGIETVNSEKFNNYELTELSSSLGTLEYSEGSIKKARRLLNQSLKSPNDNSLAQMEWLSHQDKSLTFDAISYRSNVPNSFEAFAFDAFDSANWSEVVQNSIYWFLDIPYSRRPIMLGSYVACMILDDFETAANLCRVGLQARPNDSNMLNNMVYSLLMQNKLVEVEPYLNAMLKIRFELLEAEDIVAIQATIGLAAFRNNDVEKGQEFYETAIKGARESKMEDIEKTATLIYLRELIGSNCHEKIRSVRNILSQIKTSDGPVLQKLKDEMIQKLQKYDLINHQ